MQANGSDRLSHRDFQRLASFIENYSGIKMPPAKITMIEGRLRRRARAMEKPDLKQYCAFLFEKDGLATEAVHLIDAVTTNKTEFFREPDHFRFMAEEGVPQLLSRPRDGGRSPLKIWSAACSMGAEVYTIAMVLADLSLKLSGLRFNITGTDLCTTVLQTAMQGIYPLAMLQPVPPEFRRRYVMHSKNRSHQQARIVPELRAMARFGRLNLMDSAYPMDRDQDMIFCRNILIYFGKTAQEAVLQRLCAHLRPGGYLFLGHSETLAGFSLPLQPMGPTTFRRL